MDGRSDANLNITESGIQQRPVLESAIEHFITYQDFIRQIETIKQNEQTMRQIRTIMQTANIPEDQFIMVLIGAPLLTALCGCNVETYTRENVPIHVSLLQLLLQQDPALLNVLQFYSCKDQKPVSIGIQDQYTGDTLLCERVGALCQAYDALREQVTRLFEVNQQAFNNYCDQVQDININNIENRENQETLRTALSQIQIVEVSNSNNNSNIGEGGHHNDCDRLD